MGTRSLTKVIDKDTNEVITRIYQQFDGGIDDLGIHLSEFIKQATSFNNTLTLHYNIGYFAARLITDLYNRSSYTRIATDDEQQQQFTYEIVICPKEVTFVCIEWDKIIFSGNVKDFSEFVRISRGGVIDDVDNIGLSTNNGI